MAVPWERYRRYRCDATEAGLSLDVSRVRFNDDDLYRLTPALSSALLAMDRLEAGAIANPDERRMVGHYWLRAPELAPTLEIGHDIADAVASIQAFARAVHDGTVAGAEGSFEHMVHVGIGGSALGPQLVCDALGGAGDRLTVHVLDNADPDGVDRLLARLAGSLGRTLVSVVSKTGWTPTTRGLLAEMQSAYEREGLPFARHAVATTMPGSSLDEVALERGWLARFPIWEWVGGRTSVTSAVGLLPAAVQGASIATFLEGAAAMDRLTRQASDPHANPALMLAAAWHWLGSGRGDRHMVVLPYKDRLQLLPRYLQQLVMESVGKRLDRSGAPVHQGLTVYGNKGSTDQHAYLQQLRDGRSDFFVVFVRVHAERAGQLLELEPGVTLGDHLFGSLEGTRDALFARGRDSITIAIPAVDERSLGALLALHERAVGLYAELIDVNAYHQPGVDKEAAMGTLALQQAILRHLASADEPLTASEVASAIRQPEQASSVFELLDHLAMDARRRVCRVAGETPLDARFHVRAAGHVRGKGPST